MEANLFIKSYKAEGKKIKDIQFYGDMEIDIGEAPTEIEVLPNYVETRPLVGDAFPYGTYMENVYLQGSKYYFKFRNNAPWPYFCVLISAGGLLTATLPAGKAWTMSMSSYYATDYDAYLYVFTEDKSRCVGIVYLTGLVV